MTNLAKAVDVLTSPDLAPICEMVAHADDGWVMVRAVDGAVRFRAVPTGEGGCDYEIDGMEGRNPIGNQDLSRFSTLDDELANLFPDRTVNAYPHAYEGLAHVFEHPCAPDIAVVHTAAHNWEDQGGHRGEHGSLDVVQSRAPLILAGVGVEHRGRIGRASRLIDVAPTVMAWLGYRQREGTRLDGSRGPVWLARQDGYAEADLLTGEHPDHVIAFLMDGTNPNVLHAMIDAGRAPNVAHLAAMGTDFGWGAMASFPSVTLANHTAILTGCHSGHHGILHNAYYDRATAGQILTNFPASWPWARNWLRDDVETLHEAIHAVDPHAFTVSVNEPTDRGADFSTFETIRQGGMPPYEVDRLPPRGTERFVRPYKDYRWGSRTDHTAVLQVRDIVAGAHPRFLWCNFTLTDSAAHRGGPHSEMAEAAIEETDGRIGDILEALTAAGMFERCGFLVVADHGMEVTNPEVTGDWGVALREEGIAHRDEAYGFLYLDRDVRNPPPGARRP